MEWFSGTYQRRACWLAGIALLGCGEGAISALDARAEWLVNGNRVCEAPSPKYSPEIVPSGGDGAIVVWEDDRFYNGEADIYATRILLTGERDSRWPAIGLPVCTARGMQFAPRVVADGSGGAIVIWIDARDGLWGVFAQRLAVSGSIAPGWPVDGVRLCSGVGGLPEAVGDDQGGVIAAWRDLQSNNDDVRAQHVTGAGSIGTGWPQDGLILVPGATLPNLLVDVVRDGQGGATVTWSTLAGPMDVRAKRITGSGAVASGWPTAGALVCDAPGGRGSPRGTTDGNGGVLLAWGDDARTDNGDIYAAHVLATGSLDAGWPANGVAVCTAQNVQQNPRLVSDEQGGCIAVWMDFRSGASYDIYAQRINGTGTPAAGWSQDGEPLCMAAGHQFDLAAISDGAGGMISAWQDARADVGDVYAQRITATGSIAPGWPADGVLVSNPPNVQGAVALTTDGRQGTLICWADRRFDQDDVYVQRVSASGAVGPDIPVPPLPEKFELLNPWPNPMRETVTLTVRLPMASVVTLDVVDVTGRRVAMLQDHSSLPAGDLTMTWDGRDDGGHAVSTGLYFVRAITQGQSASRKLVRL